MLKVRDVMTRDVVTVDPDMSIRDAMAMLATRHVSGAPVVAGARVLGVITASDLLDFAATIPGVPTERPDQTEEEWESSGEPADGDEPDGSYFTELWGNAGADVEECFQWVRGPEWNALEEHTVAEAMTHEIRALSPDATVQQAAEYMQDAGIHRVLVIEQGRIAGVVSSMDITRAVSDHQLTARTYVFNREKDFDPRGWQPDASTPET